MSRRRRTPRTPRTTPTSEPEAALALVEQASPASGPLVLAQVASGASTAAVVKAAPVAPAALVTPCSKRRFYGLNVFYDPQSKGLRAELDLVFIHGLNGHYIDTWKHEDTGTVWPKDLLPEKQPGARVLSFSYNADIYNNPSIACIRDNARQLLALLRDERSNEESNGYSKVPAPRPIVFLAHSLGGLIVKQLLRFAHNEDPYKPVAKATRGLLFFSTPHHGSDEEKWLRIAEAFTPLEPPIPGAPAGPSRLVEALKRDSRDVCDISEDFCFLAAQYAIVSFYEMHAWPGTNAPIVSKDSSRMYLPHEDLMGLEACHVDMCRFEGPDDPLFGPVAERIKRAGRGVAGREEPRMDGPIAVTGAMMMLQVTQSR